MISFLKQLSETGNIGIELHGLKHTYKEFEGVVDSIFLLDTINLLEDIIDLKIDSFSPPNNSISIDNSILLNKYFKNLFISYFPRPFEREFSLSFFKHLFFASLYKFLKDGYIRHFYRAPYHIKYCREFPSFAIYYGFNESYIYNNLKRIDPNQKGVVCLATHYYDLQHNMVTKSILENCIEILLDKKIEFQNINKLA